MEEAQQALQELLTSQEPEATADGQPGQEVAAETDIELVDIPVGDKTYRIPLNAEIPLKHNGQIVKAPFDKLMNAYR